MHAPFHDRRAFLASAGAAALAGLAPALARGDEAPLFGAIAYSPATRHHGIACGCADEDQAKSVSVESCKVRDARAVITACDGWAALAVADDEAWGALHGRDPVEACDRALAFVRGRTRAASRVETCVYARGYTDCPVRYQGDFSEQQKRLLQDSLFLLRHRLVLGYVTANMYDVAKRHMLSDGYLRDNGMPDAFAFALAQLQLNGALRARFPGVTFRYHHEDNNYWARAPVGVVKTRLRKDQPWAASDIEGEFEVHVNIKWLGADGDGSNQEVWAGLLAHESLHNLGHVHGTDEYGDHLQINAIMHAVRTNGRYKIRMAVPPFRCGRLGLR